MLNKKRIKLLLVALSAIALSLIFFGCGGQQSEKKDDTVTPLTSKPVAEQVTLQIFAANSLEKALPEVQKLYMAEHKNVIFSDTQFKASGDLVEQLGAGASADLLITASKGSMDTAAKNGSIDEATRLDMFGNDLIVVRAKGSDVRFGSLQDVTSGSIAKIAIGDAATVPAGQYANQALNSIGLYSGETGKEGQYADTLKGKIVLADKVGTAANYVATGDCQIGFVYTSDLYRYEGIETAYTVPSDAHKAIVYPGAVVKGSTEAEVALDFLDFCRTNPEAQKIWSQFGFEVL
ncbi:MAG: molybdate ABC transporter substrate-binding protein [Coriobacteriaceae bacterium]|nr:molybdate ABC transporter substrate-binding protein [Coriobacteriaceae bacterium]